MSQTEQTTLKPQQSRVLELLLNGTTVVSAAELSGVHRSTIYNWTRHDVNFRAALQAARVRRVLDVNERIHTMADQAIEILTQALSSDDVRPSRIRTAFGIVRMIRQDEHKQTAPPVAIWADSAFRQQSSVGPMELLSAGAIDWGEFERREAAVDAELMARARQNTLEYRKRREARQNATEAS